MRTNNKINEANTNSDWHNERERERKKWNQLIVRRVVVVFVIIIVVIRAQTLAAMEQALNCSVEHLQFITKQCKAEQNKKKTPNVCVCTLCIWYISNRICSHSELTLQNFKMPNEKKRREKDTFNGMPNMIWYDVYDDGTPNGKSVKISNFGFFF